MATKRAPLFVFGFLAARVDGSAFGGGGVFSIAPSAVSKSTPMGERMPGRPFRTAGSASGAVFRI